MNAPDQTLLTVEHLTMRFGGLVAIDDLSFAARDGRITSIIGPNGAGKTTVFNCLTGFYAPTVGRLALRRGDEVLLLERLEDFRIARTAGVARTFQNIRVFPKMSVLENLMVAQHNRLMRACDLASYWLERTGLIEHADEEAGSLSYGGQRRMEIARCMCTQPTLLCLDEPAAGLNPRESAELNELLLFIRDEHRIGQLLIEHDMSVVMEISDHVVVLDYGRKIAEGKAAQVRNDPAVIRAYLGEEEDA